MTSVHAARALRLDKPAFWPHHRSGWADVVEAIRRELHTQSGVLFLSAVEDFFYHVRNTAIEEPWVGFLHQVPRQTRLFPDLERLIRLPAWRTSEPHCRGLWSLTEYQKSFMEASGVTLPISVVKYPSDPNCPQFSWQRYTSRPRRVIMIGQFLRKYQDFYDLHAPRHKKILLTDPDDKYSPERSGLQVNASVDTWERIDNGDYDELLAGSVVFLSLLDAGANTTVVECIARATPLLVNRVGGVEEYLGRSYPLFFEDLDEAEALLADDNEIFAAHEYLKRLDRDFLRMDTFVSSLKDSAIYRSIS